MLPEVFGTVPCRRFPMLAVTYIRDGEDFVTEHVRLAAVGLNNGFVNQRGGRICGEMGQSTNETIH
jgi:hypothetical protein